MRISDWSSDVCSSDLDQLAPLARVDRGHAAAEACVAAKAHLDEHQRVAVEHHQVEFAEAVVRVRRDRAQSLAEQEIARGRLDFGAARTGAAQPPVPSETT